MAYSLATPESIPLRTHEPGRDHATLALLPFGIFGDERRHHPVTVAYQAMVDGKLRRVNVTLNPGPLGLPMPSDQTVFLALLQIAMNQAQGGSKVEFRLNDLLKTLEWSAGGRNRVRLREALDRLGHLAININTAVVARNGSEYQRTEELVHIIDRYRLETTKETRCFVEWGHIVREAFRLGDFKRLDWGLVKALDNPTATQLYRLLDRVVLSGETRWEIGWKSLAQAMGLTTNYSRAARFRSLLEPHIEALMEQGVIEQWEYQRGGKFVFQMSNYTRGKLREVLLALGVFPEAARQIIAGHDEPQVMVQLDCLQHGLRPRPDAPGGYLVEAIRGAYELRYPDDEPEAFTAMWEFYGAEERALYHRAGLHLCEMEDDLFASNPDPTAWPQELRAVVRCLLCHGFDPDEVLRRVG